MKPWLTALLLLSLPAAAQDIDDSDFSDPAAARASQAALEREARPEPGLLLLQASAPSLRFQNLGTRAVTGTLELADRAGAFHPARLAKVRLLGPGAAAAWQAVDAQGRFSFPLTENMRGGYTLRFSLDNLRWAFRNPKASAAYEWETAAFNVAEGQGVDLGGVRPAPESEAAKLGVLHLTYLDALDFLDTQANTSWWKKTLTLNWPGQADFFSPWGWSLDLTNPIAWDIVLHELGHAVMHGAMSAAAAGGQHKIDECYSEALAWSEGWATFFAGAVRLSRDDADAKFEFLVPRRAPIRLENVPADVCKGQSNEWRVSAGLWDLYDIHEDGDDKISLGFPALWNAFTGGTTKSLSTAWTLVAKGLNPLQKKAGEDVLIFNTLLAPRVAPSLALPRGANFDGRGR